MNRNRETQVLNINNFLYARGDEPMSDSGLLNQEQFSLRTWRWTASAAYEVANTIIFSTHVEMNRSKLWTKSESANFLYARGDEPARN